MHETAVTEALIQQVQQALPEGSRLINVTIEIGSLEHLDVDVMCSAWRAFIDGTPLAGSELITREVALLVRCRACSHEYTPEEPAFMMCPACGAVQPEVLQGTGVILRSLEVDQLSPDPE